MGSLRIYRTWVRRSLVEASRYNSPYSRITRSDRRVFRLLDTILLAVESLEVTEECLGFSIQFSLQSNHSKWQIKVWLSVSNIILNYLSVRVFLCSLQNKNVSRTFGKCFSIQFSLQSNHSKRQIKVWLLVSNIILNYLSVRVFLCSLRNKNVSRTFVLLIESRFATKSDFRGQGWIIHPIWRAC